MVGYVLPVLVQAEVPLCGCAPPLKSRYPAVSSNLRPSELEGRGRGQCEVVRGKRQQLDELEFLSGRGAGGGRSWQGLARAADHR